MNFKPASLLALALAAAAGTARAEPAVIYDMGGKFDKSFNQAGYDGAERWKKEANKPYLEFEISNPSQREQAMRRMAERGARPIVGIGSAQGSSTPVATASNSAPTTRVPGAVVISAGA